MTIPSLSAAYGDVMTERNTALLAECQRPEIMARNRALCRENGIQSGANELRRLHHFVSQSIIKLLSNHNITQKDGRPYVSSSPKGFLQGPEMWLVDKGYCLSGWPRGLPRGSISIWAAHYTFALATMFINETITLQPLSRSAQSKQQAVSVQAKASSEPLDAAPARATKQPEDTLEERYGSGSGSDQDADGSSDPESESESLAASELQAPISTTAAATTCSSPSSSYPSSGNSLVFTKSPLLPERSSSNTDSVPRFESTGSAAAGSTIITLSKNSHMSSANPPILETTITPETLDSMKKRKASDAPVPEVMYPGVPSGATVNWVPPVSAAREFKKAKKY